MKRKTLVLLGIMIMSITLFVFMLQVSSSSANNANFMEILFSQTSPSQIDYPSQTITDATPTVFPEGMENLPTVESLVVSVSPEQIKKNETILEDARALIEKADTVFRSDGWWHSSFQNYLTPSNPEDAKLPNGLPMPTDWKEDHWTLVDKNGYVIEEVSIQDTGSPETSQIGTFKDGVMNNITFSTTWQQEPYIAPLDGGFLANVEMDKSVLVLEAKEDILDEKPVIVYTSTITSVKPVEIQNGYWVTGGLNKYYFSKETGFLLLFEHYDVLANGQTQLTQRIATLIVEKIKEPPADILKYLQ